jgi:hypothetical protein
VESLIHSHGSDVPSEWGAIEHPEYDEADYSIIMLSKPDGTRLSPPIALTAGNLG